jgi:hypothetical protein
MVFDCSVLSSFLALLDFLLPGKRHLLDHQFGIDDLLPAGGVLSAISGQE